MGAVDPRLGISVVGNKIKSFHKEPPANFRKMGMSNFQLGRVRKTGVRLSRGILNLVPPVPAIWRAQNCLRKLETSVYYRLQDNSNPRRVISLPIRQIEGSDFVKNIYI
uniref:Uncharacterized protein n=1 Tax=Cacopsylla melanoneura TaxID=428564 RepID=A0A8D9FCI3_9HEMI